ncbi:DUF6881 domain-containing protein [Deinococcus yunweiensis]|uniref:DUF6881 domain-containing protein n=1 Tax=Deinococcus yunweiensis TaxID=367282 RepID=UPI00398EF53D
MSESSFEAIRWLHDDEDSPDLIAAELDGERYEIRKVEVFRDGRVQGVDRVRENMGSTGLADQPWTSLDSIVKDPSESFVVQPMSAVEFEALWQQSQKTLPTSIPVESFKE